MLLVLAADCVIPEGSACGLPNRCLVIAYQHVVVVLLFHGKGSCLSVARWQKEKREVFDGWFELSDKTRSIAHSA